MSKRFVVIGLGNFGTGVATALYAQGHEVVALDVSAEAVDSIAQQVSRAAVADGRQIRALERVGAGEADAGIISTGDDITASVLAALALRDIGVGDVYVKVISAEHARVMLRLGVTETIFPEREAAINLARRLEGRHVLDYVRLGDRISVQDMAVPTSWLGKTLAALALRQAYSVTAVAVHDVLTDSFHVPPDPVAALKESDTLIVAGTADALDALARVT